MRPLPVLLSFLLLTVSSPRAAFGREREALPRASPQDTLVAAPAAIVDVGILQLPYSLRRAPHSVDALAGPWLTRGKPGRSLAEIAATLSGVTIEDRHNPALGDRISVRGLGARASFGVRGVQVLVDGIPATLPDGQTVLSHIDPARLDRIEVLRGPFGALYGNAAGGVVALAHAPVPREGSEIQSRLIGGDGGFSRFEASAGARSGPVGWRVDLSEAESRGDRVWSRYDQRHLGARVETPVGGGRLLFDLRGGTLEAQNPGALTWLQFQDLPTQAAPGNLAQRTRERNSQVQAASGWEGAVGGAWLTSRVWLARRRVDNPIPPSVVDVDRWTGGLRTVIEGRTVAARREIAWSAGIQIGKQRDLRRNFENLAGDRGALTLDQMERVEGLALFGQAALPLTAVAGILVGLRHDQVRFSASDHLVGAGEPDDSGSRTLSAWSPSVGLSIQPDGPLSLYAGFATAFETPTTTELVNRPGSPGGFNPDLSPQLARSIEAGLRLELGVALRLQIAVYRIGISNQLVPFEVAGSPGRTYFRNAGTSEHRGLELGIETDPGSWWWGRAAFAMTDARFKGFETEDGDYSGNRIPGAAPSRIDWVLRRTSPQGAWVELAGRFVGRVPADDAATAHAPAYAVTDLRLGSQGTGPFGVLWEPFFAVENVLDVRYAASVTANAFGGRFYEPGPARTLFAGISIRP